MKHLIELLQVRWNELETSVGAITHQIEAIAKQSDACQRLMSVPGVGMITATALVSAVGDAHQFRKARDLAAWIGLVPRQYSTGGKPKLLGIKKGGNPYLRKLFVHGARSTLAWGRHRPTRLTNWSFALSARSHANIAVVALANKLLESVGRY